MSVLPLLVAGLLRSQDAAPSERPWLGVIAKLASSISQNDAPDALEAFDSGAEEYGTIEADISALAMQTDVLCALDVIDDKEDHGSRVLDVDWYMQLTSRADGGPSERRRQRVSLRMQQIRGKWKIVSFHPIEILNPIHIN